MAEILKSWLIEFKKIKLAFGMAEGRYRICPYCKDTRPISADGVMLSDRFCPNCGKAVKIKEDA